MKDHTANGHANLITSITNKHDGLHGKIRVFVSDNAEVMKSTARILRQLAGVFPHTLNLVVNDGLKSVACTSLLTTIRNITSHFKRSAKSNALFKNAQMILGLPQHKIIRDCETRWSSTYAMLERYVYMLIDIIVLYNFI